MVTRFFDQLRGTASSSSCSTSTAWLGWRRSSPGVRELLYRLTERRERTYRRALMTNSIRSLSRSSLVPAVPIVTPPKAAGLAWPPETFSLAHIALPFSPDDSSTAGRPTRVSAGSSGLGLLSPRGERAVLVAPIDVLMRVSSNPFYSYLEEATRKWVERDAEQPAR